jgi:hypothetical protein
MARRIQQVTIPVPYEDVKSLRASVMALKELAEELAGQRGSADTTAVTAGDMGVAMEVGMNRKVSKSGDTMTGALTVPGVYSTGYIHAASTVQIQANNPGENVHVQFLDHVGAHKAWIYYTPANVLVFGAGNATLDPANTMDLGPVTGFMGARGYRCKYGYNAGYDSNYFNIHWNNAAYMMIDATNIGQFAYVSDYRIKKDVVDLPSMWDAVKRLRPVSYTHAEFTPPPSPVSKDVKVAAPASGPLFKEGDIEHWGFVAHELQETLTPSAANGEKDMVGGVQSPNWPPIMAAVVKALQEAIARIEVLEANG